MLGAIHLFAVTLLSSSKLNVMFYVIIRFRMQQVNIVGSSPMSAPSRLIQTLQAAPDTHPSNLRLVSATQTSLRFSWKVRHCTHRPTHTCALEAHLALRKNKPFFLPLYSNVSGVNLAGVSFGSLKTLSVCSLIIIHQ